MLTIEHTKFPTAREFSEYATQLAPPSGFTIQFVTLMSPNTRIVLFRATASLRSYTPSLVRIASSVASSCRRRCEGGGAWPALGRKSSPFQCGEEELTSVRRRSRRRWEGRAHVRRSSTGAGSKSSPACAGRLASVGRKKSSPSVGRKKLADVGEEDPLAGGERRTHRRRGGAHRWCPDDSDGRRATGGQRRSASEGWSGTE